MMPVCIRWIRALPGRTWFWITFAGLLAVQCVPFLLTAKPPLQDYPNHLARLFILTHWAHDPFLKTYYTPDWQFLPNLAFDILGSALSLFLPIFMAGQVSLIIAVLLLAFGLIWISSALYSTPRSFCLLGFIFLFSKPFSWGFVNLILGFGLALFGIGGWLRLRERPWPIVLCWSVPFALALFFAHLFAFGAYGLTLACIELDAGLRAARPLRAIGRSLGLGAAQLLAPALIFLFASPTAQTDEAMYYGDFLRRIVSVPLATVRNFNDALDVATFLVLVALLAFGFWTGRLRIAREMRLALVAFAVISFFVPKHLSSADNVQMRAPVMAALLLAGAGEWIARSRREFLIGASLILLFTIRTGVVVSYFETGSRYAAELERALMPLPQGVRIASMTVISPSNGNMRGEWEHSICYAVIEKSAFVPSLFTIPGQQPLRRAAAFQGDVPFPATQYVSRPGSALPSSDFAAMDYVLVVNPDLMQTSLPATLTLVSVGHQFRLYRVQQ
jgi:hypothetical protein